MSGEGWPVTPCRAAGRLRLIVPLLLAGPAVLSGGAALAQVSWTGGTSSDWTTGGNWSGGTVPGSGDAVTVNSGTPNAPLLNGGTATVGSLSGNGTISLGGSAELTVDGTAGGSLFSGTIVGTGYFTVDSDAALVLTGRGSDVDLLTVCSCSTGELEIRGGSLIAESGVEVLGGTLAVTQGGDLTTELDLELDANLEIDGAGSSVVVDGDTYIGFVGSATATISDGGLLESQGYAQIDAIVGTPSVLVTGSGSEWDVEDLLLVGDASFGGYASLTVADGGIVQVGDALVVGYGSTLYLGNGGEPGVIETPEIENNGEIYADFSGTWTLDMDISGDGALTKAGSGTLVLNGDNSYWDATWVESGTLVVNGSLDSPVLVWPDAVLSGSGTLVGGVMTDGILAPGNSIGTLTVENDVFFLPDAVYQVEVDPATGESDLIRVTGAAVIFGGAVRHVGKGGTYRDAQTFTILTADDGVYGEFDGVASDYAFLDAELGYDDNSVYLTLARNNTGMDDIGDGNRDDVGGGLQSLPGDSKVAQSVTLLSVEQALEAYEALSGELYADVAGTMIEESRLLRELPLGRLRQAFAAPRAPLQQALAGASDAASLPAREGVAGGLVSWAQAFGAWGRRDSDGNAAAVDHAMGGLLVGTDAPVAEHWRLGLFTGYDRRAFEVEDRSSTSDADSVHLGLYGGARYGAIGLALGAAYSRHFVDSSRAVVFPGFAESLEGDYGASTAQVFAEASYEFALGAVALAPYAGLAYVRSDSEAFTETGGEAALAVEENDHAVGYSTLGLRAAGGFELAGLPVTASGALGWRHAYGELAPDGTASFEGGDPFTIEGLPVARDVALLEAGLAAPLGARSSLGLSYAGQLGDGYQDHGLQLTFSLRF